MGEHPLPDEKKEHWDSVYGRRAVTEVSWYEAHPDQSLALIQASGLQPDDPIIDVGGGASLLGESLLDCGYLDLTILDISGEALEKQRSRLGVRASAVTLVPQDVTTFLPARKYALWHDRAVFHFLVEAETRERYRKALRQALRPNGYLVIATFGPEGPERCSGLPVKRYDSRSLAAELGGEFRLVESSLHTHQTPGGAPQQFLYCRFQSSPSEFLR